VFEKAARQATAILPFLTNIKLSQFILFPGSVAVQSRQVQTGGVGFFLTQSLTMNFKNLGGYTEREQVLRGI
jgi:hypothetical protein